MECSNKPIADGNGLGPDGVIYPGDPDHCAECHYQSSPTCEGCGNKIDPKMCCCGQYMEGHEFFDNHTGVPMGCNCGRI